MRLIDSIPKKLIRIHGFDYEVYTPMSYSSGMLRVTLNGEQCTMKVRVFSNVRNPYSRHKLFKADLLARLNKLNRFVEKHYRGDKYRLASLNDNVSYHETLAGGLKISYYAYCSETFKNKKYDVVLSKDPSLTKSKINKAVAAARKHRASENEKYNLALSNKRKQFRLQVESEIMDRDIDLVEQALFNT